MLNISYTRTIRAADQAAVSEWGIPSPVLMERAAMGVVDEIVRAHPGKCRVLVAAGAGNNGGDGFAAARLLRQLGWQAEVFFAGDKKNMSPDCALQEKIFLSTGGQVMDGELPDLSGYGLIVDALFGTGLSRDIEGKSADLIRRINESGMEVLSVDVPSGIHADTGRVLGLAIKASTTVTFSAFKPGMILFPGTTYCGNVIVHQVGSEPFPKPEESGQDLYSSLPTAFSLEEEDLGKYLPERTRRSSKGTYGRTLLIEGCDDMPGAAVLSAKAAYMTGCGLAEVFTTSPASGVIVGAVPEAVMTRRSSGGEDIVGDLKKLAASLARASSVCVGPGLSQGPFTEAAVSMALECEDKCVVADADALRAMCFTPCADRRRAPLIITPHPGEMAFLTGKSIPQILEDPLGTAAAFAREHELICVLKDAVTVITDGKKICLNRSGCDGMATAGAGDVLTGMIGSLLAQGSEPFMAACLGVYIHGLAGEKAMEALGRRSMRAGDIAAMIHAVIRGL